MQEIQSEWGWVSVKELGREVTNRVENEYDSFFRQLVPWLTVSGPEKSCNVRNCLSPSGSEWEVSMLCWRKGHPPCLYLYCWDGAQLYPWWYGHVTGSGGDDFGVYGMSYVQTMPCHCCLVQLSNADTPIVLFHPDLNKMTSLPNVDLITRAGHAVYTWSFLF